MISRRVPSPVLFAVIAVAIGFELAGTARSSANSFASEGGATGSIVQAQDEEPGSGQRTRGQPGAWKRGPIRPFRSEVDRERARREALKKRSDRRAFEGAPPVMPHSALFGKGSKTCLDCHTEGMKIGDKIAHPMSHPPFSNCVQCHVESANHEFPPADPVANFFEGLGVPGPGTRLTSEAPPQVPHDLAMRGQCLSCHGEFGYRGLRTTHPQRIACVQCHVGNTRGR